MAKREKREGKPRKGSGTGKTELRRKIDDLEAAQKALRESEERYRTLFEAANDAILIVDTDESAHRIVAANAAAARMHGYELEELTSLVIGDLRTAGPSEHESDWPERMARGERVRAEMTHRKKDGGLFSAEMSVGLVELGGHRYILMIVRDMTDRERAEEAALAARDELFSSFIERAPVGVYRTTPDGRILMANPAMVRMLGYDSFAELARRNLEDEGYDADYSRKGFKQVMERDGEIRGLEAAWRRRDGRTIYVLESARTVRDESGEILYYEGTVQEVTERRRAEQALRESEEKYRHVFENAVEGIAVFEELPDGRQKLLDCNPRYAEMSGYSKEELLRIGFTPELAVSINTPEEEAEIKRLVGEGKPYRGELSWRRPDGAENYVEYRATSFRLGGRKLILGIDHDITERRRTEAALRESEERYRQAVENSPNPIFSVDAGGIIRDWNRSCERAFGRGSEVVGQGYGELAPDDDARADLAAKIARVFDGKTLSSVELSFRCRQGSVRDTLSRLYPVFDALGKVQRCVIASTDVTERRRAESALRESEEKFRTLIERAADAFFLWDMDGRIVDVNESACESLGYGREELLSMTLGEVEIRPRRRGEASVEEEIELGRTVTIEAVHRRKDGSMFPVEVRIGPFEMGDRTLQLALARDITERKRGEQAVRESEAKFRSLLEGLPHGVQIVQHGRITFANSAAARAVGLQSPDEMVGRDPLEFAVEGERERMFGLREKRLAGDDTVPDRYETARRRTDGTEYPVEAFASRVVFDGRPAIQLVQMDITERKRTEEAIHESEQRYRAIFQSSRDAILIIEPGGDEPGRIVAANRAAGDMHGFDPDQLLFTNISDLLAKGDAEQVGGWFEKVLAGEWIQCELEHRRKDGTVFPLEMSAGLLEMGEHRYVLAIGRDITERRRMEDEGQRVEKLESVGLLAGGIAHDFNNLMSAVIGNLALAKLAAEEGSRIFERLGEAERAGGRVKDLTQQLLTFAKGGAPVKRAASIPELVEETAVFALRGSIVRPEFSFAEDLSAAEVDSGQISQVVHNLIINAMQAMPEGGALRVSGENAEVGEGVPLEAGRYVKLTFSDEGTGISPDHVGRIFDPYFTTKQEGSGLGLAVSYAIVRKHGGHLTVRSVPGEGTTFTIYLPATDEPPEPPAPEPDRIVRGRGRILLMDDDEALREVAAEILCELGYEASVARTGEEALAAYSEAADSGDAFDAVIMDLTVRGGMGGAEAVRELLRLDPAAKALVSSGYANDPVLANFADHGFVGVVAKPYDVGEMSRTIHDVLSAAGGHGNGGDGGPRGAGR